MDSTVPEKNISNGLNGSDIKKKSYNHDHHHSRPVNHAHHGSIKQNIQQIENTIHRPNVVPTAPVISKIEEPVVIPVKVIPPHRVFKLNQELNVMKKSQEENIQNQKLLLERLESAANETARKGIAKLLDNQIKKGEDLKAKIESIETTLASGTKNKYVAPSSGDSGVATLNGPTNGHGDGLEVYDA